MGCHKLQNDFLKVKEETGSTNSFELRLWDSRIGRWMSPDPYGQFASPYLGMGNNPINGVDPDGGCWDSEGNPCPDGDIGDTTVDGQGNTWTYGENGWNTSAYDEFEADLGILYSNSGGTDILPVIGFDDNNPSSSWGMTMPPVIFADSDAFPSLIQHENGHALQFGDIMDKWDNDLLMSNLNYYYSIGIPSFINGAENSFEKDVLGFREVKLTVDHNHFYTETDANRRAIEHYRSNLEPNFKDNYPTKTHEQKHSTLFKYLLYGILYDQKFNSK